MCDRETAQRRTALEHVPLFAGLSADDLERVAALFETASFPQGAPIIDEGQEGNELYVIKSGTVEVRKKTASGDWYTVTELCAGEHAFFGEMALLDLERRSATVVCKTGCEFYRMCRDAFVEFGNRHPEIGLKITREISRILCRRLRKANHDIIVLFDALVGEMAESGGISDEDQH